MRTRIKQTNWQSDAANLIAIRYKVFVEEQGVPEDLEIDDHDDKAWHFLAIDDDLNKPIATARLLADGHVGRMAVLEEYRSKKIGHLLLNSVLNLAKAKGIKALFLNAQLTAQRFYEKAGFETEGEIFIDAGIEHVRMIKQITIVPSYDAL